MKAFTTSRILPLVTAGIFLSAAPQASAWDRHYSGGCAPRFGGNVVVAGSPFIGRGGCAPWGGGGWGGGGWGGGWGQPWIGSGFCAPRGGIGFSLFSTPTFIQSSTRTVPSGYYRPSRASYSNDLAVDVQRALRRSGYYAGEIDGDIGPESRAAIRDFQLDRGLPATGRIDGALLRSLRIN